MVNKHENTSGKVALTIRKCGGLLTGNYLQMIPTTRKPKHSSNLQKRFNTCTGWWYFFLVILYYLSMLLTLKRILSESKVLKLPFIPSSIDTCWPKRFLFYHQTQISALQGETLVHTSCVRIGLSSSNYRCIIYSEG